MKKFPKPFLNACLFILAAVLLLSPALMLPHAGGMTVSASGKLSGETGRTERAILLPDGTKTGVTWTQVHLDGTYGENKMANIAEFSLSNPHLSLEVLNCGDSIVGSQTMDHAAEAYNQSHPDQTVLAAINGDLWMTKVHSGPDVTTKVLKATRGFLMIDGEIWATQQIDAENAGATNGEKGTPAGNKMAFGVTEENQPLIGSPDVKLTISVGGQRIQADGLNRLPAIHSLIVYNHRIHSSNYALNDAYEIELEADDPAFRPGGRVSARVKAVYPANSSGERPAIGEKTILLTARGNRVQDVRNRFPVGQTVTIEAALSDRHGHTDLWQHVTDAIGGHMATLLDGRVAAPNSSSSEYPSALIGYKDDGSVMLVTVTSALEKKYAGLRFSQAIQFCTELGYNSVFYLDGGGSTTFVSLEEGSYTVRNQCSDGQPRYVINGVGVVWNREKVCDRQGNLDHIRIPADLSKIPASYVDGALLGELCGGANAVRLSYDPENRAFCMTTSDRTNDPYATMDLDALQPIQAEEHPYIVFKVKTDCTKSSKFVLYYGAGKDSGADPGRTKTFYVEGTPEWQYITVDMSKSRGWTGAVHNIRLDIFDSAWTEAGVSMYIGAVVFCRTAGEAAGVKDGWAPEGAVTDYLAYLESLKPVVTEPPTEEPTEPPTEPPTEEPTEEPTEAPTDPESETLTEPETPSVTEPLTKAETLVESGETTSGCRSHLAFLPMSLFLVAGAVALACRKRHRA